MIEVDNTLLQGLTFIDLFAGIGGFRLALESLGAQCVFASEINKNAANTYYKNYGHLPDGDITKIDEKDIPDHDILCAGFPCQSFSASGKKLGFEDSRGTLFYEVARIVRDKKPKVVFLENVMYFVAHDNGRTLQVVKDTIESIGYRFYYSVLNSADYGVPQQRKRTYMVAFRSDLSDIPFIFPSPAPLFRTLKDIMVPENEETRNKVVQREFYVPRRKPKELSNEVILEYFFNKAGQGERVYSCDGVSITVSTTNKGIYHIPGTTNSFRRLIPREVARLMGFPDSFILPSIESQCYKQLGNSVVVDVIQYIGIQIANTLFGYNEELRLY